MTPATPPDAPTPSAEDKFKAPAQKPGRSPNDMLPPAAATPEAPGSTGLAAEVPSLPATHRTAPVDQDPEPSERFTPPVPDDRG